MFHIDFCLKIPFLLTEVERYKSCCCSWPLIKIWSVACVQRKTRSKTQWQICRVIQPGQETRTWNRFWGWEGVLSHALPSVSLSWLCHRRVRVRELWAKFIWLEDYTQHTVVDKEGTGHSAVQSDFLTKSFLTFNSRKSVALSTWFLIQCFSTRKFDFQKSKQRFSSRSWTHNSQ